VLVGLPAGTGGGTCSNPGAACDTSLGLSGPSTDPHAIFKQSVLDAFCAQSEQADASPVIASDQPVCALQQVILDPSDTQGCSSSTQSNLLGWCLVEGAGAQALGCTQAIEFTPGEPPAGTVVALVCP
jgi:hypothetical protein